VGNGMKIYGGVYEMKKVVFCFSMRLKNILQYGVLVKLLSCSHCSALPIFLFLQKFHVDLSDAEVVTDDV
jgi:hypothetical protein